MNENKTTDLRNIYEKLQKSDIKNVQRKQEDDIEDISKLITSNPVKFLQKLMKNHSLENIVNKYLKDSSVNKNDPDLQLFVTALVTIVKKINPKFLEK